LGIGESYTETVMLDLPLGLEGDYTIVMETDATSNEGGTYQASTIRAGLRGLRIVSDDVDEFVGEGNNRASAPIAVEAAETADLIVSTMTLPQRGVTGQPLNVSYAITNAGVRSTGGGWRDLIYLSRDESLDPRTDFFLGFHDHRTALEPGEVREIDLATRLPKGLSGSYFVFVLSDPVSGSNPAGSVFEDGAETNIRASAQPLLIEQVPPADLIASDVAIGGGSAPGAPVNVNWTVTNQSAAAANGRWSDAVYLSRDGTWDIGDTFLGRFEHSGGLDAGESYAGSLAADLPILSDGAWRVLVRTDARNEVFEDAFEANNTTAGANPINVESPLIPLGIDRVVALDGASERLFRIEVPAGETLRVSLSGGDPNVPNEVFVKAGSPPSQSDFDASHDTVFGTRQEAIISSTEPGIYYILVRSFGGDDATPETDHVLRAEVLPFQILSVSPDQGGSARFVTMTIDGAGILPGAVVKLSRPGVAEFLPVSLKRIDATRVIATFDLEGAEHGLYDVIVTNADGAEAVLPYRYLVERQVERDVTVGLGGPRVVPAGQAGFYSVSVDSLTNVDTPYVYFTFGAPEIGTSDMVYGLPFLEFATNVGDGSDAPADGLTGAQSAVNLGGQLLAPGYAFDLAAEGQAQMTFAVQTYPGLQALIDRDFEGIKTYLYNRFPDLEETDALAGGVDALEAVDPLIHEIFTDPGFDVISGDLPWYLPFQFNVVAAATPMTRDEFVAAQRAEAEKLRQAVLADAGATPALQTLAADADAWTDGFLAALETAGLLRDEADAPPVFEQTRVTSLIAQLSQGLLLGPAGDEVRSGGDLVDFYAQVRGWYGDTPDQLAPIDRYDIRLPPQGLPFDVPVAALPDFADFDQGLSRPTTFTAFNVYSPWLGEGAVNLPDFGSDATTSELEALDLDRFREIAGIAQGEGAAWLRGPVGAGDDNWVPEDAALPHEVGFELDEASPRPARELRIVTTLDEGLDARSFRLGGLTLGDLTVQVPPGRLVYQTDIDLSATRGFVLRVSAGIDLDSRTASWLVQAIDAATGEVLEGEGANGLLRPGEAGSVRYTVQADEDAASGAVVAAEARVILDVSAPEDTDPYTYRLDQGAPITSYDARRIPGTSDYRITWSATDEAGGSGVRDANIYVSLDDGDFRIVARNETTGEFIYTAPDGARVEVLVLARDVAGNRAAAPPGVAASGDIGQDVVDLGGSDVGSTTQAAPLPVADGALPEPVNALFVQALEGVPATISPLRPGMFATAVAPFAFEAFVGSLPGSQGGIGALAVLGLEDGSVLYSGGPDRAWLYRVDAEGAGGAEPLSRLGLPIYDLSQAPDGRLWATSGGGALLELDADTGEIIGQYGDGITQSVTVGADGTIYVSTGDGVAIFNAATETFTAFSNTRVDDLAIAPDGSLWGTSWPDRGRVLRFGADGQAEVIAQVPAPLDSITFGTPGTEFAGLALLTSVRDGAGDAALSRIFALDVASHQIVSVAAAPIRGEGIAALADGRVIVAHGTGLDVLRPLYAPEVIASTLVDGQIVSQPVASFSFRFDDDMATSGAGSVLDPANFALIDGNGEILPITSVDYDSDLREVTLRFASLPRGIYAVSIAADVQSARGVAMGAPYTVEFTRLQDATANVRIEYQNTRYDRQTGTATYEVIVTNIGARPLLAPLQLTLDAADPTGSGTPLSGVRASDLWLIDLTDAIGEDGILSPGESATALAVTLLLEAGQRGAFEHGVRILPGSNSAPVILEDMPTEAEVGTMYEHTFLAADLEGDSIGFVLVSGPDGMVVDPETGRLTWTPDENAAPTTPVVLRAYDDAGGFGEITWEITIEEGLNSAPQLEQPTALIELVEGEQMRLPFLAFDDDLDMLLLFADKLPRGAYLDQDRQELVWTPQPGQRGLYQG
ncbi:MAG: CARDB domain-containing protein, partial [Roseovarius sp.]|nr:CARDB domain-containing protein [Roseovarius sp.]